MAETTGPADKGALPCPQRDFVRHAVARYERPLTAYAAHLTGTLETARDVVQETFVRLCSADRTQIEPRLAQWLFTVCRNLAIDHRRKQRRMPMLNETESDTVADLLDTGPGPSESAERHDAVSAVLQHLAHLPPVQQEVIRLKFQHGLSYKEIGEVLNLTATNVGFLIHTGLKTLRQRLANEDGASLNQRTR